MKHPVILDACTIINLLRIDEDEFLFKSLKSLDLNIAHMVYDEVNKNILRNSLSEEQQEYIKRIVPSFLEFSRPDKTIIKDLSQNYFNSIIKFVQHRKKHNGELLSSALSLCLSRKKECKVYFYTDDFPAKEQFTPFFNYQQIGVIGDSIDLLLFLYWVKSDFKEKRLKKILQDLKAEYNMPLKEMADKVQKKKDAFTPREHKNRALIENIDKILIGYKEINTDLITEGVSFFRDSKKYSEIKNIVEKYPNITQECELLLKIQKTFKSLKTYEIFKIA